MGLNFDVSIYKYDDLKTALVSAGCEDGADLESVLARCGTVCGDHYVIVDNERSGDCNPWDVLLTLLIEKFTTSDEEYAFSDRVCDAMRNTPGWCAATMYVKDQDESD